MGRRLLHLRHDLIFLGLDPCHDCGELVQTAAGVGIGMLLNRLALNLLV